MIFKHTISAILTLVSTAAMAQAAPPLVSPVIVPLGGSVHLTPIDQNSVPITIAQCSLQGILATMATSTKDASGFVVNGVGSGTFSTAKISCTDGVNPPVVSATFTVTVSPPPYSVTAVGDTMP